MQSIVYIPQYTVSFNQAIESSYSYNIYKKMLCFHPTVALSSPLFPSPLSSSKHGQKRGDFHRFNIRTPHLKGRSTAGHSRSFHYQHTPPFLLPSSPPSPQTNDRYGCILDLYLVIEQDYVIPIWSLPLDPLLLSLVVQV